MEKFKSENLIFNKLNVVVTIVCVSILLAVTSKCGTYSLYAAIIVKKVDAKTRAKTSLNELLRED